MRSNLCCKSLCFAGPLKALTIVLCLCYHHHLGVDDVDDDDKALPILCGGSGLAWEGHRWAALAEFQTTYC